jgi:heme exporter protein C
MPEHATGSRTTRILGWSLLVALAVLLWLAFVATDPDVRIDAASGDEIGQFDAVRLIYVHVPVAIVSYLAFAVTALGSGMVLVRRSVWWDIVAGASAEIGAVTAGLTLITGSIWGRPIWNTYWRWDDVRLMTMLVLFMLSLGYLAVRRLEGTAESRAKRAAIVGVLLIINAVIVNQSVEWWASQTLHQQSTITDAAIEDLTLFTFMYAILFGIAGYAWLLIKGFRVGWLERQNERFGLADALEQRRAEAQQTEVVSAAVDTGTGEHS